MSSSNLLDTQSLERKERLSKLKNLKRKQQGNNEDEDGDTPITQDRQYSPANEENKQQQQQLQQRVEHSHLSGRNYDVETGAPRLGFDVNPSADQDTLEMRAAKIALDVKEVADNQVATEKPIDLFSLQPKAPNWDLKRDVDQKLEKLEAKTNNAIARLVRERILSAKANESKGGEDKAIGIEGDFAEMVRQKQREAEIDDTEEL